jgi:hypothetical protein
MASKADILLQHVYQLTTYDIRVPAELYPRLFLTSAVAEFMGALLFISDQRFGCWVLVGIQLMVFRNRWWLRLCQCSSWHSAPALQLWYTILNTALMHNFWDAKDTAAVQANWTLALKVIVYPHEVMLASANPTCALACRAECVHCGWVHLLPGYQPRNQAPAASPAVNGGGSI